MKHQIINVVCMSMFIFFLNTHGLNAQIVLPQPIISKVKDRNLLLRWEPTSIQEWKAARTNGYHIEVMGADGSRIFSHNIIPLDPKQFESAVREAPVELAPYFDACMGLIHPDQSANGKDINDIIDQMIQTTEQTADSFRLSMLSFYSSYNMELANAVGLGIMISDISQQPVSCTIHVNGFPSRTHNILKKQKPELIPSLTAKWGDHHVRLEWNVQDKYKEYIGYYIERSSDGNRFFKLDPLPYLDPAVGIDGSKNGTILGVEDSLQTNYIEYYYRLKTMDYFGYVSEASAMVKGYGFDVVQSSPQITHADQDLDNKAFLIWDVNAEDIPLIKAFNVLRADKIDGQYESIDTFSSEIRQAHIPMVFETNYYRIEIIPKDGEPVSSFPVFVMGMDTIPPVTPLVIGAVIDTLGRVSIQWHPNTEADLWGYRIFRSNFDTNEYSLQNANPILDSVFIDSVSLHLGIKNVYYVLQAVDKRNNRSPFTAPIELERPDIIPPGVPVIVSLQQSNDTINVRWGKSGSDDVVLHQLFRRDLHDKVGWKLIAEFDTLNNDSIYIDAGLSYGKRYAYTMRAIDDVDLISGMATMKVLETKAPQIKFEPNIKLSTTFDKVTKEIQLAWTCDLPENLSSVLVYRGWDKEKLGKYKYVNAPETSLSDIIDHQTVYYMVKVHFKDHSESYYSDVIEYIVEE